MCIRDRIRLEEQGTDPTPNLLGEEGRQLLTEKLYSARTIREGALEHEMEPVSYTHLDVYKRQTNTWAAMRQS